MAVFSLPGCQFLSMIALRCMLSKKAEFAFLSKVELGLLSLKEELSLAIKESTKRNLSLIDGSLGLPSKKAELGLLSNKAELCFL